MEEHRIVNNLHIVDKDGHIYVYTESEYQHQNWWEKILIKFNFK